VNFWSRLQDVSEKAHRLQRWDESHRGSHVAMTESYYLCWMGTLL